ncbi:MAG TPA: DUF2510 domain-containing protein [Solirubrobacteraceae bacterium]|nr:DUF2510 domain-containing protein [Solirubrobacteraceae bacterium]
MDPLTSEVPHDAPPRLPPAGWYPDPEGPDQRYWDGSSWTGYRAPRVAPAVTAPPATAPAGTPAPTVSTPEVASATTPAPAPAPARATFVADARVRAGRRAAGLCALGLLVVLVAGLGTFDERGALDLAASPTTVYKPGIGYLLGPLLIALALPRLRRSGGARVASARGYRPRLVITALLWLAGLAVLVAGLAGLSDAYAIKAGAYVAAALQVAGLAATLAMWPAAAHAAAGGGRAPAPASPATAPTPAPASLPPADWYDDPLHEARLRYWDGRQWTASTGGGPPDAAHG